MFLPLEGSFTKKFFENFSRGPPLLLVAPTSLFVKTFLFEKILIKINAELNFFPGNLVVSFSYTLKQKSLTHSHVVSFSNNHRLDRDQRLVHGHSHLVIH
jgi:hypothetical protein